MTWGAPVLGGGASQREDRAAKPLGSGVGHERERSELLQSPCTHQPLFSGPTTRTDVGAPSASWALASRSFRRTWRHTSPRSDTTRVTKSSTLGVHPMRTVARLTGVHRSLLRGVFGSDLSLCTCVHVSGRRCSFWPVCRGYSGCRASPYMPPVTPCRDTLNRSRGKPCAERSPVRHRHGWEHWP